MLLTEGGKQLFANIGDRNIIAILVEALIADRFLSVSEGIDLAEAPGPNTILIDWTTPNQGSFGDSAPGGVGEGVDDSTEILKVAADYMKHSPAVQNFLLSQALNKQYANPTSVEVYVDSHLEWTIGSALQLTQVEFVNALLYTASHEAAHTLGLLHAAQLRDNPDANEVPVLIFTGGDSGDKFTLTFDGKTTADIDRGAAAGTVRTAWDALVNIGPGNVAVSGGGNDPYIVTFLQRFEGLDLPQSHRSKRRASGCRPWRTIRLPRSSPSRQMQRSRPQAIPRRSSMHPP